MYNRFIELKPRAIPYLVALMKWFCLKAKRTGIAYIDSTSISVCHNKRISRHKTFKGIAEIGKTSKGWFYGLKLHLATNERGEVVNLKVTQGNVDDRKPVSEMTKNLEGILIGDKGYISSALFKELYARGLKLVTGIKGKMKNKLMEMSEKVLLKKRSIIETIFSVLKGTFELEHTRHRSIWNAAVHMLGALVAYSMKPSKPSIKFDFLIPN